MSGIFGYISAAPDESALRVAESMGARMRHLDHQIVDVSVVARGVALGRLGIGIFNRASQPVVDPSGCVCLVLCGEFYHQDVQRRVLEQDGSLSAGADDSRFALACYLRDGIAGLTALEGAFTIAVWDARVGELAIVNDRFGLYPHYYAHHGGALSFAPEIKGILAAPEVPRRLDVIAVTQYLRFQQLLGERTWFEDVHLLPPASILRFHPASNHLAIDRYWDWDRIRQQSAIGFNDAVEELVRLFQRAIDAMTATPHRVGVYLSGGLDGRTILGFIPPQRPVMTITYGAAGCRDVVYAREIARRAGRPHRWFPFEDGHWIVEHAPLHLALTEGMHSWMHAHGISTLAAARELIDVNLSGWDGGTIFGGYLASYTDDVDLLRASGERDRASRLFQAFCHDYAWPGLTDDEYAMLLDRATAPYAGAARQSFDNEFARSVHYPPDRRIDYFYLLQHVRRSSQNQIVFARSSIEVRCPFFDYSVIEFVYALPEHIRRTPALYRSLLTQRAPHLALVPYDKDDLLPHSNRLIRGAHALTHKVKRRIHRHIAPIFPDRPRLYADYEHYLRTDLRAWAEAILFDERTLARGLFQPAAVRALWNRHLTGTELWTIGKIAPLISLELVLRVLHDEIPIATPRERESAVGQGNACES